MLEGTERGRGFSALQSRLGPRPASFPVLFVLPELESLTLRPAENRRTDAQEGFQHLVCVTA